jgi:hypothetical protein
MKTFKLLVLSCLLYESITGQQHLSFKSESTTEKYAKSDSPGKKSQTVRILFYNAENFYDPYDDTTKMDDEFTPGGLKHWTYGKFRIKLFNLAKVIIASGQQEPPAIVGLCEIENRYVLNKIIYDSPLKKFRYRIVHHESPDVRGVDVALLYRPEEFRVISWKSFPVKFPFDTVAQTREILYIKGTVFGNDTLHLFINHWPSRLGDYSTALHKRDYVAGFLREKTDSIFRCEANSNVVIMGDFNDEPDNASIIDILGTKTDTSQIKNNDLFNLMYSMMKKQTEGTIKYQGKWSVFDQIIVSGVIIKGIKGIAALPDDAHIFNSTIILEPDVRYLGYKPNRTYVGPRYHGGFSDHLPVYLDIREKVVNSIHR